MNWSEYCVVLISTIFNNRILTVGYVNNSRTYSIKDDRVALQSGRGGDDTFKPDILTLGVDIKSLDTKNGYSTASGSSYVAAIVTGVVSLLIEKKPLISEEEEIRSKLMNNVIKLSTDLYDQGRGELFLN